MDSPHKKRRQFTTQMLRVLKHKGPMIEKLLAFYLGHLGYSQKSVPKKRRELEKKNLIRCTKAAVMKNGRLVKMWEITN